MAECSENYYHPEINWNPYLENYENQNDEVTYYFFIKFFELS